MPTISPELQKVFGDPLPQIGAVLRLNTELPQKSPELGSRHWALDGSCVLVAGDRVLTISHTLKGLDDDPARTLERCGIFLPYEGLIRVQEHETYYSTRMDNPTLLRLEDPVRLAPPLLARKIPGSKKSGTFAFVAGYGGWLAVPHGGEDGLQRRVRVDLGLPSWAGWCDTLDLCWWSEWNGGRAALVNNSGGPMMWLESDGVSFSVVGVNREQRGPWQTGTWVGQRRFKWLRDQIGEPSVVDPGTAKSRRREVLEIAAEATGRVVRLEVPAGAEHLRVTVNASAGFPLDMEIAGGPPPADFLTDLAARKGVNSGRFLTRTARLSELDPGGVFVGVSRVASAPVTASRVVAQLCAVFF